MIVSRIALIFGLSLVVVPAALASDYCVNRTGCTQANTYSDTGNGTQLNAAINAASAGSGNRVLIGAGTYSGTSYNTGATGISIIGAGQGQTVLQDGGSSFANVLTVTGAGSTVSDLTINIAPGSTAFRGLGIFGSGSIATRVTVTEGSGANNSIGILPGSGATVSNVVVSLPGNLDEGVAMDTGPATLINSTIMGGLDGVDFSGPNTTFTIARDTIKAGSVNAIMPGADLTGDSGTAVVDDSLLLVVGPSFTGLQARNGNSPSSLSNPTIEAARDTIVGDGSAGQIGADAHGGTHSGSGSNSGSVALDSSVLSGVATTVQAEVASGGDPASVTTTYSNYDATKTSTSGSGATITQSHQTDVSPGFVNAAAGNYHLLYNSKLVDAGNPAALAPGTTDLGGNPRPVNGIGGPAGAVTDIGAYEYQRPAPTLTPIASPNPATTGQSIGFTANGSSAASDPGDPVSVSWSFDDGAAASGDAVSHAFSTPGPHSATARVTASNGQTTSQIVTVTVNAPASGNSSGGAESVQIIGSPKSSGNGVRLQLHCSAPVGSRCQTIDKLTVTLTVNGRRTIAVAAAHRTRKHRRTVVLGAIRVSVAAGSTTKITITLNAQGRKLLELFHQFPVSLVISLTENGRTTVAIRRKLTIKPARKKHRSQRAHRTP